MKRIFFFLLTAFCLPIFAQSVASTPRGIVVAHDRVVQLFNANRLDLVWRVEGVETAGTIVVGDDRIAVLDPLASEVRIVELSSGQGTTVRTGETPVAGLFIGRTFYLLERDARALERIGADGARASIKVAADPAFLRQSNGRLYACSRVAGVLQEITTTPFAVRRSVAVAPFASDFETDAKNGYLVYPREARLREVDLGSMQLRGDVAVGAVPSSIGIISTSSALTARTFAIADPSAKRVWMIEGAQSLTQAVARGFLRGLIGLGLGGAHDSEFPTGVDRVLIRGRRWVAYDSSSGTLYRFDKSRSAVLAKNVEPQAFTATPEAVFVWDETVRRLQRFSY